MFNTEKNVPKPATAIPSQDEIKAYLMTLEVDDSFTAPAPLRGAIMVAAKVLSISLAHAQEGPEVRYWVSAKGEPKKAQPKKLKRPDNPAEYILELIRKAGPDGISLSGMKNIAITTTERDAMLNGLTFDNLIYKTSIKAGSARSSTVFKLKEYQHTNTVAE